MKKVYAAIMALFALFAVVVVQAPTVFATNGDVEWESDDYGGTISVLAVDDTYVYVGGYTTQTVQALDKTDGSLEWESDDYGGTISALAVDDTYVYVGGEITKTVQALDKTDGSLEWGKPVAKQLKRCKPSIKRTVLLNGSPPIMVARSMLSLSMIPTSMSVVP